MVCRRACSWRTSYFTRQPPRRYDRILEHVVRTLHFRRVAWHLIVPIVIAWIRYYTMCIGDGFLIILFGQKWHWNHSYNVVPPLHQEKKYKFIFYYGIDLNIYILPNVVYLLTLLRQFILHFYIMLQVRSTVIRCYSLTTVAIINDNQIMILVSQ